MIMSTNLTNTYRHDILSRQKMLVNENGLGATILIVGAGGIGSNAAHIAASTGFNKITICDFDDVGWENIHPGFLSARHILSNKAEAVANDIIERLELNIKVVRTTYQEAIEAGDIGTYDIVIVSTDSLSTRVDLWSKYRHICYGLWIDARMGGTLASVYSIDMDNQMHMKIYDADLLSQEPGSTPCGEKATAPLTKGFISGMIGQSLVDFANGKAPRYFQRYDMGARIMLSYSYDDDGRLKT